MIKKYLEMYKDEIKKSIEDLKRKDTFYKQIPNLLTFIRLVGGIPAGLMYFLNPYVSIGAIALLWFTDAVDGRIAKKFNIQSKLGADMDAFADKIMFLSSALPLLATTPGLILNFILEGIISFINVAGRVKGLNTKTVISGKVKTVCLALTLISGYLVQFFAIPSVVLELLMIFTTGFQFIAIKDYILEVIKMNNELKKDNCNNDELEITEEVLDREHDSNEIELTPSVIRTSIEELQKEREFYLGFKEPDKIIKNVRERKKNNI